MFKNVEEKNRSFHMYLFPFANAGAAIIAQVSNMYEV
jgi:hypothetical protein